MPFPCREFQHLRNGTDNISSHPFVGMKDKPCSYLTAGIGVSNIMQQGGQFQQSLPPATPAKKLSTIIHDILIPPQFFENFLKLNNCLKRMRPDIQMMVCPLPAAIHNLDLRDNLLQQTGFIHSLESIRRPLCG